ncbi:MAG: bacteriorhodopsin [Armatimonadota bacterium]
MPLYTASSGLTTIAFGASFVREIGKKNDPNESDRIKQIRQLEKAIFGVATGIYALNIGKSDFRVIQKLRYLDWAITTPMLLRSLHLLAQEKGFEGSFIPALSFNLAMIAFGYLNEFEKSKQKRQIYLIVGFIAYAGVLKYVYEWGKYLKSTGSDVDDLLKFFYIGWTVYGLNTLTPNEEIRQSVFNISDLFNKGIYSLVLEDVIQNKI